MHKIKTMLEGIKQTNKHVVEKPTGNLLSKLTVEYMSNVRAILINKPGVTISFADAASVTLKRRLEHPEELAVREEDEGQYPIFNRSDIIVNNEDNLEERITLTSLDNTMEDENSRCSVRDVPRSSSRGSSGSPSTKSRESAEGTPTYIKEDNKNKRVSPVRENPRWYSKREVCKSRRYDLAVKREVSPKMGTSRRSRERGQNLRKRSSREEANSKKGCRNYSPEQYNRNYNRPYSPRKSRYGHRSLKREDYVRSSSPCPKRFSRSLSPHRRRSRSPHRRRSKSPYSRKCRCSARQTYSPHVKDKRGHERKQMRRSITRSTYSSYERDKNNACQFRHDRGRERRSQSPRFREHSCSSHSRRSSSQRDNYSDTRSASRSETWNNLQHEEISHGTFSMHENQYRVPPLPHSFGYYGAHGLWIPGPVPRPHYIPKNIIPAPMAVPGGPFYFIPRPYMHQDRPFRHFQPHYRPRTTPPSRPASTVNAPSASANESADAVKEEPREEPSSTTSNDDADSTTV